ncbi:MAG: hypothetical protein ACOYXC_08675 [Candidatus Rifleibacteriota bacterium]
MVKRSVFTILMTMALILALPGLTAAANPFSNDDSVTMDKSVAVGKTEIKADFSRVEKDSGAAYASKSVQKKFYQPIGKWTGRLYLPKSGKRDIAGGVVIRLENCPDPAMRGKLFWIRWDTREPWEKWFYGLRYDVKIDPEELEKALQNGLNPPVTLNGWKKVSPLESLAGARPGDMTVMLKNPVWTGKVLLIKEEPVQICGAHYALVKFLGPAGENRQRVVHFNPATGDFSGPKEIVTIPATFFSRANTPIARSSTVNIEKSPLNDEGWYIYGRHRGRMFEVEALEPRTAFALNSDISVSGKNEVKSYISREHFDNLRQGLVQRTEMVPDQEHSWQEGDRGLLIHVFGWREHPSEKSNPMMMGLVTGHFAFGMAEVVRCPFSGDLRWDYEYRQAYAHNREGIVAGSSKWHCYSGSLKRGWMYTIPISDTVIRIPELDPYDFDGWPVKPWSGLNRQFEKMQALYRTGAGTGISSVRPDISCVQDSHAALYSALRVFEETIAKTGAVKKWLGNNQADPDEIKRYLKLLLLVRDLKKSITTFGIAQSNWRDFFKQPLAARKGNMVKSLINAILSKRSVFPRKGNDNLLRLAADKGYQMWSILTCQIGGDIPDLEPLAPSSPTAH